jgi:phosphatidate cytidylyltransferase
LSPLAILATAVFVLNASQLPKINAKPLVGTYMPPWLALAGILGLLQPVSFLAGLYLSAPMAMALDVREKPDGFRWLAWGVAITWLNDACAYVLGGAMGGVPLPSWINSRKTWRGLLPGWAISTALSALVSQLLSLSVGNGAFCGLIVAVSGSTGDLLESAFKRRARVNDSGSLLPGYGGVLDRLDSLLVSLPAVAMLHRLVSDRD